MILSSICDIRFSGVQISSGLGAAIQGMEESPIHNLTLENIRFDVKDPTSYKNRFKHVGGRRTTSHERDTLFVKKPSYFTVASVDGLFAENIRNSAGWDKFENFLRAILAVFRSKDGIVSDISRDGDGARTQVPTLIVAQSTGIEVR